jgi:hypothetical protein
MSKKPIRQSWAEQRAKAARGGMKARLRSRSVLRDRLAADSHYSTMRRQPSLPKLKFLELPFPEEDGQ